MSTVRRALLLSSSDRYIGLVVNFAMTMVVSRLLTPAELGEVAIGTAIVLGVAALREFATPLYLVQQAHLIPADVDRSWTLNMLLSGSVAAGLFVSAPALAHYFNEESLAWFIRIVAFAVVIEASVAPIAALLQRDLRFGALAAANVGNVGTNAVLAAVLAALGFGPLSFALSWLGAVLVYGSVLWWQRPRGWRFRYSTDGLSGVWRFCAYHGLSAMLVRAYETLPVLLLGRLIGVTESGLFARALLVSQIVDKIFLGVAPVALAKISEDARAEATSIERTFLNPMRIVLALYWPLLAAVVLFAEPLVLLVLGSQWHAAIPLVRIMAVAAFVTAPTLLVWPIFIATGGVRERFIANAFAVPPSIAIIAILACFDLRAAVAGLIPAALIQSSVQLVFLRRLVAFEWRALGGELARGLLILAASVCGPLLILGGSFAGRTTSWFQISAILLTAVTGWLVALIVSNHPVWLEIRSLFTRDFEVGGVPARPAHGRTTPAMPDIRQAKR